MDSNIPTPSGQSADQALINGGGSPLPAIPFSDILHNIFKAPSFDTSRYLRGFDKAPGQQPLYDSQERVADPQGSDCEFGTYAMFCSLCPPRLAITTPAAQVMHWKSMCGICTFWLYPLLSSSTSKFRLISCTSISAPPVSLKL